MPSLDRLDGVDCLHKVMWRGKEKQSMFQTVIFIIIIVFTIFRLDNVFYQRVEMEEHSALVNLM